MEDPVIPGRFWLHHSLVGIPSGNGTIISIVKRFQGCGSDLTGDGLANASDAAEFGTLFMQGAPEADFEPDGVIDAGDFVEYLQVGLP